MSSSQPLVLVVEDEPQMRRVHRLALESNGMRCLEAATAREAMNSIRGEPPDIIVADLGLPDQDGIEVIRRARASSAVPIIVLSARAEESQKVTALDAGADDYVTKPFAAGELLARLRVALRHSARKAANTNNEAFVFRELNVDLLRRQVTVRGQQVHLTPIEYRLLVALLSRPGQVVTHRELLRAGWGPAKLDQQHYLRIFMTGLRRKIEIDPARPQYLLTETGIGYRLQCD
jgi:two-component system KDP operon response regulator KdpE